MPNAKWDQLLHSRKFWAGTLVLLTSLALYALDELSGAELADAMALIAAIYIGAVAVEDGLTKVFRVWLGHLDAQPPRRHLTDDPGDNLYR